MSEFIVIVVLPLLVVLAEACVAVLYCTDVIEHCRKAFTSHKVRREPLPASVVDQEFDPYLRVDQQLDPCLRILPRETPAWPDYAVPICEDQHADAAVGDGWPNLERA